MAMTEQEIRADERAKIICELWGLRPCLREPANAGLLLAIQYIKGATPVIEPQEGVGGKWRDVPVTAGMLLDRFLPCRSNPNAEVPFWAENLMWAAKRVTGEL